MEEKIIDLRGTLIKYTEWLFKKGYIDEDLQCVDYEIAEEYLDSKASLPVREISGRFIPCDVKLPKGSRPIDINTQSGTPVRFKLNKK